MLKIFVTGDNHIGLKYANHEKAEAIKSERINAFTGMIEAANSECCSLFVITGDLFENTYGISKKEVNAVMTILTKFKGTVMILPGNHDYYDRETKLWQYVEDIIKDMDNILLLNQHQPYSLDIDGEDVVIYPAHCTSLHSKQGENNLKWIKDENIVPDDVYRIGIAHGAVLGETIDREGEYFLMNYKELEEIPVDVWLLGHTHTSFPKNISSEYCSCQRVLNPGTHVQTDVSCNTEGICFIVEIESNKELRVKKYASGGLHFYRKNIIMQAGKMEEILERELSPMADNSVVDIILTGAVTPEEYDNRHKLMEEKLSRFLEGSYNDKEFSKVISKDLIISEFPETSFSAGLLLELLNEPKEAQLAYELLKSLKEGK